MPRFGRTVGGATEEVEYIVIRKWTKEITVEVMLYA